MNPLIKALNESTQSEEIFLDRTDAVDLAHLTAQVAVHFAFNDLLIKKKKYDREYDPADEEYEPFDFSVEAVADAAEDFLENVRNEIEGLKYGSYLTSLSHKVYPDLKKRTK